MAAAAPTSKHKFRTLARKIAGTLDEDEAPPPKRRSRSQSQNYANFRSKSEPNLEAHSSDELSAYDRSSGEGSEAEIQISHKKKGLIYQKTENFCTRMRDMVAMSDVFIARGENPPFVACLQVSVWFIPVLLIFCIWDTLAVTVFEIPYLSSVDYPGFILGWHCLMTVLAMYGFMLSYLSSGYSPRTKLAAISTGIHYLLLFYRVFVEIFFDGYRGQWKLYYEKTIKLF